MGNNLNYLPFDMSDAQPTNFGGAKPEGWYLLKVSKAEEKMNKDQVGRRWTFECDIVMGPGWSQEYAGQKMFDSIGVDDKWKGLHMGMAVACFGSIEAVKALIAQHGGRYSHEMSVGRVFMAQVTVNKAGYNNVQTRLPYVEAEWQKNAGASGAQSLMQPAFQAPAAPMQAPPMQQFQAPPMQQPQQQFQAPPMQAPAQFAPPMAAPPVQGFAPPAQQPGQGAPQGFSFPLPPPPTGTVAGK